jgi:hypothetical protein
MWLVCSRRMRTSLDFLPRPAREFPSSATLSSWSKGGGELLASQETNGSASRLIGGLAMPQSEGGRRRGRARKMTHDPMHPAPEPDRLRQATRCGARTRSGRPCQSPAVTGRRRCRMHGGAPGSGGPKGSRNGNYKHGRYSADAVAFRSWLRQQIREVRALTKTLRTLRGR